MGQSRQFTILAASLLILVFLATVYITKAFITTIMLSIFLAYIMQPIYQKLYDITGNKHLSVVLPVVVVLLVFMFVFLGAVGALATELSNLLVPGDPLRGDINEFAGKAVSLADKYLPSLAAEHLDRISELPIDAATWAVPALRDWVMSVASSVPVLFTEFSVAIFFTYYLIIDGPSTLKQAFELLPQTEKVNYFLEELDSIYRSLFQVFFINSIITGLIAVVGFFLLGVPYPVIWGSFIALLGLIPMLGSATVFLPISAYYLLVHDYVRGLSVLVFSAIFLMFIPENVIRPRLAMRGAAIHPIITLMAFTAPIFVVGMVGVIIGPALYGFVLAALRTMVYFRNKELAGPEIEPL